jgi:pimeloyl-ACP methyl ester carboxylesterase
VMASRIPNTALKIIDDASHMVVTEKPQQVAHAIQDFLRGSRIRKTS